MRFAGPVLLASLALGGPPPALAQAEAEDWDRTITITIQGPSEIGEGGGSANLEMVARTTANRRPEQGFGFRVDLRGTASYEAPVDGPLPDYVIRSMPGTVRVLPAEFSPAADGLSYELRRTYVALIVDDSVDEADETIEIAMSGLSDNTTPSHVRFGGPSTLTIRDNDETPDTVAPSLSSARASLAWVRLAYGEPLNEHSVPGPAAFTARVTSAAAVLAEVAVIAAAVTGTEVVLTLAQRVESGNTVTISYAVPTATAEKPLEDLAGNDAPAFTGQAVTVMDADVTGNGVVDASDALTMYYAYVLSILLGDGTSGTGFESDRRAILGPAAPSGATDADLRAMLLKASDWKRKLPYGDVTGEGSIDQDDALVMYYAYTHSAALGDGTSGSGSESSRRAILGFAAQPAATDADFRAMLLKANAIRNPCY